MSSVAEPRRPEQSDTASLIGALQRARDEQRALFEFTDRLYRAVSIAEVYDAALDAIFAALRCDRASILLFDEANVMQFVAARGLSTAYRAAVTGHTPWKYGEPQPSPISIDDISNADVTDELRTIICGEGIAALGFFPIVASGGVVGKFMTYFDRPHAFSAEEMELAITIARQMGFAVERSRAADLLKVSEDSYRAVVDSQSEVVVRIRADGHILFANNAFARVHGTTPDSLIGKNIWDFIADADVAESFAKLSALTPEAPEIRIESRFRAPQGERWTLWTSRALKFGPGGRWQEALASGFDITHLKRAEELQRLVSSIVENSDDAIISKDLNGVIVSWNKGAERVFGYKPEEIIGRPVLVLIPPEHQDEEPNILERIRRGERIHHYETVRRRKDGSRINISLTVSPVKDSNGTIVGASKIARDITERKRAEEQRTQLINELNHRVKNTLATVQSLAMQTLKGTERSEEARELLDSRLAALARAHDLLTQTNWEGASLQEVVKRALTPFATTEGRIVVTGPSVRLTPKQALALSITLHELATNAAKYGALSNDSGQVTVEWSVGPSEGPGELQLTWAESGGPAVAPPTRAGFGTRFIERHLAHELGGVALIEYRPDGVVATVSSPLECEQGFR